MVFFLMIPPPWRGIVIQYFLSEVCFTTWYLNLKATQTRHAVVERIGRVTVLCPRATHVGVVPRDIVVGVGVHHPHMCVTRTPVQAVQVQAYVRIGSRTIRLTRFIAMIPAVFTCKLTTLFP